MTLPQKSKHINFQFQSEELDQYSVCRKFRRTTQTKKSSAQSSREKLFSKKYHKREVIDSTLPACFILIRVILFLPNYRRHQMYLS